MLQERDRDGDDYFQVGAGEAEVYAANPTAVPQPPAETGETYRVVDVSRRSRQALGGAAFEGARTDRVMPQRLLFDRRAFGNLVVNPLIIPN